MNIFISYSHRDRRDLDDLRAHLRPLTRGAGAITAWSDLDIKTGEAWREEIRKAIADCHVAILLVSATFLASDFIIEEELAPLFERHSRAEITILCVPLSHCSFASDEVLSKLQSMPSPDRPIRQLGRAKRDEVYDAIRRRVQALGNLTLAAGKTVVSGTAAREGAPGSAGELPRVFNDQTIRLADFVEQQGDHLTEDGYLEGYTFTGCKIEGPGAIVAQRSELTRGRFAPVDGRSLRVIDHVLLTPAESGYTIGTVGFIHARFIDCEFRAVSFVAEEDEVEDLKALLANSNLNP